MERHRRHVDAGHDGVRAGSPAPPLRLGTLAAFLALYALAAGGALQFVESEGGVAAVWPASGVSLAAFLIAPRRAWGVLFALLVAIDLAIELRIGDFALPEASVFASSLIGSSLLGAFALTRRGPVRLAGLADVAALLFWGALVTPFLFALPPAWASANWLGGEFAAAWWWWGSSCALAVLVITPVLLAFGGAWPVPVPWPRHVRLVEFGSTLAVIAIGTRLIFTVANPDGAPLATYSFLLIPAHLWVALRFGIPGAALGGLVLSTVALVYEGSATGSSADVFAGLLALEAFLGVTVGGGHLVGGLVEDRRSADRLLREGHELIELATAGADIGLWSWIPATGALTVDERWAAMMGYSIEELSPVWTTWEGLLHPADREEVLARLDEHVRGAAPRFFSEHRMRAKDDSWRWVVSRGRVVVRDDEGRSLRIAGSQLDVSAKRRAEAQSELLGQVINGTLAEIFLFRPDSLELVGLSEGARKNLALSAEQPAPRTPLDVMSDIEAEELERLLLPLRERAADEVWFDARLHRTDGSTYRAEVNVQLVDGPEGSIFCAEARDVTDRRAMEQQLQQAQKMEAVGQLTGGVAHDFNNLLAVIIGNLEFLADRLKEDDVGARMVSSAFRAAESGAELTRRLLAFSRRQPLEPKRLDANQVVRGMEPLLRRTIGEDIEVEAVLAGGMWTTLADPAQLEAALLNLAVNAKDAMPRGGRLTIETANLRLDDDYAAVQAGVSPGQYVMLAVTDTGAGMSPEVIRRAFEPFFTTKGPGKGSGLGLAMVHGFCYQSGGHVSIYSEVGKGSTVKLYLPRVVGTVDREEPLVSGGTLRGAGETVLVLEDDEAVRELTGDILESLGYHPLLASDSVEALDLVQGEQTIDLFLTDVVLAGAMNGREAADAALRLRPGLGVLFMSGYTENAIFHHGRLDEGVLLLQKPFRRNDLARKVREALERR